MLVELDQRVYAILMQSYDVTKRQTIVTVIVLFLKILHKYIILPPNCSVCYLTIFYLQCLTAMQDTLAH